MKWPKNKPEDSPPSELVEKTAALCKAVYCDCRARFEGQREYHPPAKWEGGRSGDGSRRMSVWERMARFFLKMGFDPAQCIIARFQAKMLAPRAPLPNQLYSYNPHSDLVTFYAGQRLARVEQIKRSIQTESLLFTSKAHQAQRLLGDTGPEVWRYVLYDETVKLSPLFRWCVAQSEQMEDVTARYESAALLQYSLCPDAYDDHWREILPADIKRRAGSLAALPA